MDDFIVKSYDSDISTNAYYNAIKEVGIWESEKIMFKKYVSFDDKILDLCCGAGRTTFNLFDLGYKDIIGVDISKNLINAALSYGNSNGYSIKFLEGDATNMSFFPDNYFNVVFISYNSLMTIPKSENRIKCLKEVQRVLKSRGILIFTTHDREDKSSAKYFDYWKEEKYKFDNGVNLDKRLYEFGDKIVYDHHGDFQTLLHFPDQKEVRRILQLSGFDLLETKMRYEIASESKVVKDFSGDCRFYVAKKRFTRGVVV